MKTELSFDIERKTKFLFDLDGTLLNGDFAKENEYFKSELTESDSKKSIPHIVRLLANYERKFKSYDIDILAEFLTNESKVKITPNIVRGWIDTNKNMNNIIIDGVVETLEYLKRKDKELVILTNWFSETQIERLKKSRLDIYFEEVFGGEIFLKPNKNAYENACGSTPTKLCVMIGDNYEKDYLGPREIGIDSILYDPTGEIFEAKDSVKTLSKIKGRY